jgi:SRSO17 transposase
LGLQENSGADVRFEAYATKLAAGLGHADRVKPFQDYCVGLLTAEGRKSVEPLAALTAPERTAAQHQSLLHFVAAGPSSDATMLSEVRAQVLPVVTRKEPVQALIVDDTSFPKKGKHSVGVTRQYCGERGKQDNCQVAVSLSVATHQASLPIAYQLYLPQDWADDADRRAGGYCLPDQAGNRVGATPCGPERRPLCGRGVGQSLPLRRRAPPMATMASSALG